MKTIPLTRDQVALIDDEDFEKVSAFKWQAHRGGKSNTYYARRTEVRNGKEKSIWLHRFVLDAPAGIEVDHIDRYGLNCQKSNLRLCTHSQNLCNIGIRAATRSGFKGVFWKSDKKRWRAEIKLNGKSRHLGYFREKIDAALAYNRAAALLHGEFAWLNTIPAAGATGGVHG